MASKTKKVAMKTAARRRKRVLWTKAHERELRSHSKAKTAVKKISKLMKRTESAVRMRAMKIGIPLGHRR
jgi:hypothetical protein